MFLSDGVRGFRCSLNKENIALIGKKDFEQCSGQGEEIEKGAK